MNGKLQRLCSRVSNIYAGTCMRRKPNKELKRSFRRFIKQLISSVVRRQCSECQQGIATLFEKLQELEESIEIVAREVARLSKMIR